MNRRSVDTVALLLDQSSYYDIVRVDAADLFCGCDCFGRVDLLFVIKSSTVTTYMANGSSHSCR